MFVQNQGTFPPLLTHVAKSGSLHSDLRQGLEKCFPGASRWERYVHYYSRSVPSSSPLPLQKETVVDEFLGLRVAYQDTRDNITHVLFLAFVNHCSENLGGTLKVM